MVRTFLAGIVRHARQEIIRRLAAHGHYQYPDFRRILVVAPHPDDETFGMGGLIAKLAANSIAVYVAFLTSGGASHNNCCTISDLDLSSWRENASVKTAAVLGIPASNLSFLRFKDGALPHPGQPFFAEAARRLGNCIIQVEPDAIFAPHPFEGWPDHIAAEELTKDAIVSTLSSARLFNYCVWFWFSMPLRRALKLDWRQAFVVEMPQHALQKKREAMNIYLNDLAPCGKPTCGVLPSELLHTFEWTSELFFASQSKLKD
jgi:LmbE family N-acetylglucosaminyl deacetylase